MALLARPQDVQRYVRHNARRRSPLELGLPWMSYAVIDFLNARIGPSWTVHEYGSGGSTVFLAQRAARVVSVESSPEWYHRVRRELQRLELHNVDLRQGAADFAEAEALYRSDFFGQLPDEPADLILIDSEDHHAGHRNRPLLFAFAERRVRPGGFIVVDDADRYRGLRRANAARAVHTLRGTGPGRTFVSMTDLYQY